MTTMFVVVKQQIVGTPADYEVVYDCNGIEHQDRAEAIRLGVEALDHDDFSIATVVGGRLVAFGFGMDDFGPDEDGAPHGGHDLDEIARQIGLATHEVSR
ncbi:hypothetical protein GCM10010399_63710 [Dactylosporangium fulvum]|uniref:Uncharacterized protein n=1 Tax=Dactylosporangium fulvum TaxID=53359 RepID=A0ABY5W911_9ACTN|nr:hypothetical protein [Dactylosporangium fulvum]UWP85806.1 hypothetical protein Dfulv_16800 [Dactylosporangium fulvum]